MFNLLLAPKAYLDPGSGSYLIQILIATLVGAAVAVRLMWSRITSLFHRESGEEVDSESDQDQTDQP